MFASSSAGLARAAAPLSGRTSSCRDAESAFGLDARGDGVSGFVVQILGDALRRNSSGRVVIACRMPVPRR